MMGFIKLILNNKFLPRGLNCTRVLRRSCLHQSSTVVKLETGDVGGDHNVDSKKKGLVLGLYETGKSFELSPAAQELNQKTEGKIDHYLNELSCELKVGKAITVTGLGDYSAVALTSLGPKDAGYNQLEELDEARENVRCAVGAGVRALVSRGCGAVAVAVAAAAGAAHAAAEAAELAAWRFQEFKSCKKPETQVSLYGSSGIEEWERGAVYGRGQNWARLLSDMPANNMTPVDLAQAALEALCPLGVRVVCRERAWLEAQGLRALLLAARGACRPPALLECEYRAAAPHDPLVLLAGKAVTFDSGGLCLKPADSLRHRRGGVSGAAAALGALRILAELKVPINVVALIPICENMISGQCMKVGDVVRALNGVSIQIEDTDMEGRLMLADALVYGQTLFKPDLVIDVATMTNGEPLATAAAAYGCFTNSEDAWAAVRRAGAFTGDRPWRYPLWTYYRRQLTDDPSVDLRNRGSGHATPCLGAAFLSRFVCCPWVHVETTGVGRMGAESPPYLSPRRATGRPARALAAALETRAAAADDDHTHHRS